MNNSILSKDLLGHFKTFGFFGPAYQILDVAQTEPKMVHIKVIETGEELDYPLEKALDDPEAK